MKNYLPSKEEPSKEENKEHYLETNEGRRVSDKNQDSSKTDMPDIDLMKEVLLLINLLISPNTTYHIETNENCDLINNLMACNFIQYRKYQNEHYSGELYRSDSWLSKVYNINAGFQCYYLIEKVWDHNFESNFNIVQEMDDEHHLKKYWRVLRRIYFSLSH